MAIGKSSIARAASTAREYVPAAHPVEQPLRSAAAEFVPIDAITFLSKDGRCKAAPSAAMVQAVQQYGILEPLLVAALPNGTLILLSGHQRLAAAHLCKLTQIPVVLRNVTDLAEAAQLAAALLPFATGVDLLEEKFTTVSSIRSDLPAHLL